MKLLAIFLSLFVLPLAAIAAPGDDWMRAHRNDGVRYQEAFSEAIKASDRVVFIEHSDRADFPIEDVNRKDLPRYEYRRVELSAAQKASFLRDVLTMESKTQTVFTACMFIPHHTLEFYSGKRLTSSMQICFHCGDIQWDGTELVRPEGLFHPIMTLLSKVGFEQERDWEALRKQAQARAAR